MAGLILLFTAVLPIIGFVVGVKMARGRASLPRAERQELDAYRDLVGELGIKASEHAVLGDTFATIVLGMLNDHRKAIRGK